MWRAWLAFPLFVFLIGSCHQDDPNSTGGLTDPFPVNVHPLSLDDDASCRRDEPGHHEWWNFFAEDKGSALSVSAIFLNGNMFDVNYRVALEHHRLDPETHPAPHPADYQLLQLNVIKDGQKRFTTIRSPPGTATEFASNRPYGRIGESWFEGVEERGERIWRVHISSPDMINWLWLEADIEYRDSSRAFTVADGGFFAPIPEGYESGIHFPVAWPVATGHVRITNRLGQVMLDEDLTGGGHTDHVFGRFYSDLVHSYYFGRLSLGMEGDLVYFYHFPRSSMIAPYGWLVRIPSGGELPIAYVIETLTESEPATGSFGLDYYAVIEMFLRGGGRARTFMECTAASEDWPFQITGIGHVNLSIPGDLNAIDAKGIAEYGFFDGLDDPLFRFLFSLLDLIPWIP